MIQVEKLQKTFRVGDGEVVHACDEVSFQVKEGQFFTLLGPSGCGKTTLLRCIAGLESVDSGSITIDGTEVLNCAKGIIVPPNRRRIGMVFQSYAIWPHMDVFANAAFPLKVAKRQNHLSREDIRERVHAALKKVQLDSVVHRPSTQLSGGQQQRLAFARALVAEPKLLLLDEPLSNLDAQLRVQMRAELKNLQEDVGITTIYVTHDQSEALAMSDQIAVIANGQIRQQGDPISIYRRPINIFVANFVGSTNSFQGVAIGGGEDGEIVSVQTETTQVSCVLTGSAVKGQSVVVMIRPEMIEMSEVRREMRQGSTLEGVVCGKTFLGDASDYMIKVEGESFQVRADSLHEYEIGRKVYLVLRTEYCCGLPL